MPQTGFIAIHYCSNSSPQKKTLNPNYSELSCAVFSLIRVHGNWKYKVYPI